MGRRLAYFRRGHSKLYNNTRKDYINEVLPAPSEETEVAAVTSGPGNEVQAFDLFLPVIHSTQNYTTIVSCKKKTSNQEKFFIPFPYKSCRMVYSPYW